MRKLYKTSTCAVLTVPEAADILGIGRNSAYEAATAGTIPSIRGGKRLLIPRAALLRMLGEELPARELPTPNMPVTGTLQQKRNN